MAGNSTKGRGQGAVLQYLTDDTADTYTSLGCVYDISGPNPTRQHYEAEPCGDDVWIEKLVGLIDAGQLTFTVDHTASAYDTVWDIFTSGVVETWRLYLPGGGSFSFDGILTELPLELPNRDKRTFNVTIEVSGAITWNPTDTQ